MVEFLSTIPRPSIILMVVYYQAHNYYTGNYLRSLCPNAPLNYTTIESWSMICLYGFGSLPWVSSLTSADKNGPAVIKTDILLPKGWYWKWSWFSWKTTLDNINWSYPKSGYILMFHAQIHRSLIPVPLSVKFASHQRTVHLCAKHKNISLISSKKSDCKLRV